MTGVGIDVSKDSLVVAIAGSPWVGQYANSPQGHKKLVRALLKRCPDAQVVVEPTATYHMAIATLIAQTEGLKVMVANPRQTAAFAKVINQRGKTDTADAAMLALFSQTMEFNVWTPPSESALRLRDLVRRRLQRVNHQTAEKNRLKELKATGGAPAIREDIEASLTFLKERILALEKSALELVKADPALAAWFTQLVTVPGIGNVTALGLIAELACLPADLGPKQLTAIAGLDPQPRQSGTMDAQRRISRKGNKRLRTVLYLLAWNASTYSPHVQAYRDALLERGKLSNVAYIAVARRLLVALHGMRKTNTNWNGERFYALPA